MSFQIHAAGRITDAVEQVKNATGYGDASQFEAARDFVLSELKNWPEHGPKGVLVEANGHHDAHSRNITISIRPLFLKD